MNELEQNLIKFNTCRFRSEQEIERVIHRCSCQGGNYNEKGFFCEKRDIFKVAPETCVECTEYESK